MSEVAEVRVLFDAIVLAGGRSTRLGAGDKAKLRYRGTSLLEGAVAAVAGATTVVVVGPHDSIARAPGVITVLEEPRFAGPAAALAAGCDRLPAGGEEWVIALACDVPRSADAVAALLTALPVEGDGVLAIDADGRRQPLLAVYRKRALRGQIAAHRSHGPIDGLSIRRLIETLHLAEVLLDAELCADIDTPQDAARFGIPLDTSTSSAPDPERVKT